MGDKIMKKYDSSELSLEKIDDYYETPKKKRRVIFLVIASGLLIGVIFFALKYYNDFDDYVGTPENPGITAVKR
ncbi:MAG: hypothetical protein ACNI3C_12480 [Candidatus Marinarcus sp.]|uniref:hypothetical protein n=1 Tax=Candidatus Marinarcus sp. TaxID=3100987 RepID=UPI003AFFD07D